MISLCVPQTAVLGVPVPIKINLLRLVAPAGHSFGALVTVQHEDDEPLVLSHYEPCFDLKFTPTHEGRWQVRCSIRALTPSVGVVFRFPPFVAQTYVTVTCGQLPSPRPVLQLQDCPVANGEQCLSEYAINTDRGVYFVKGGECWLSLSETVAVEYGTTMCLRTDGTYWRSDRFNGRYASISPHGLNLCLQRSCCGADVCVDEIAAVHEEHVVAKCTDGQWLVVALETAAPFTQCLIVEQSAEQVYVDETGESMVVVSSQHIALYAGDVLQKEVWLSALVGNNAFQPVDVASDEERVYVLSPESVLVLDHSLQPLARLHLLSIIGASPVAVPDTLRVKRINRVADGIALSLVDETRAGLCVINRAFDVMCLFWCADADEVLPRTEREPHGTRRPKIVITAASLLTGPE